MAMMLLSLQKTQVLMLYAKQVSAVSPLAMTTTTADATIHMITQQKRNWRS